MQTVRGKWLWVQMHCKISGGQQEIRPVVGWGRAAVRRSRLRWHWNTIPAFGRCNIDVNKWRNIVWIGFWRSIARVGHSIWKACYQWMRSSEVEAVTIRDVSFITQFRSADRQRHSLRLWVHFQSKSFYVWLALNASLRETRSETHQRCRPLRAHITTDSLIHQTCQQMSACGPPGLVRSGQCRRLRAIECRWGTADGVLTGSGELHEWLAWGCGTCNTTHRLVLELSYLSFEISSCFQSNTHFRNERHFKMSLAMSLPKIRVMAFLASSASRALRLSVANQRNVTQVRALSGKE